MLSHMLLQKAHFDNQLRFQKFTPVLELKAVWTHKESLKHCINP